ncbi:group II intron reverse transcriptase/maturase [Spirochaetales bacterium NM-380-WT-3C1]|uniref:RNA-directed DNA polymerase n=1 Tax=Bullifex porci TaxID=2606638 RepID=A0A7X2PFE0_9SPIO|nr:group II intron reverse transcriptase/maturase [Bullifex porci]MSU07360.1 group II intron reverse transcriptase/maturase [Bullifex porci]
MKGENHKEPNTELCRRMLSLQNLEKAINAVKRNKGSAGVDGVKVDEIESYMHQNWKHIEEQILARTYKPQPVKRVEIPKDNGGVRLLGVPCVIDRVIQQAMVQVLTPVFEPTFSDYSYGFRPNRSAEDAVRKAQEYMAEGYKHVVDLDLSKFFDRVNHDYLMTLVDNTLKDKDIRRLIFVYLKSGIMCDGCLIPSEEGTPQGGPLSPMLSNIYLTPYDKELERRGHKFVRYADDCNIFTKSKYACNRVKESVIRFLEGKMKLKVNTEKTEARRVEGSSFLGFTFTTRVSTEGLGYCRPKDKKLRKFEDKIREITSRSRGVAFSAVVQELNAYIRGWINYYARSNIHSYIKEKAAWIRRRLRQYLWKQWKTPSNRRDKLQELGIPKWRLDKINCYSSCRWYKISSILSPYITNNTLFNKFNLVDIEGEYKRLHRERRLLDRTYNSQSEFVFI